MPDSQPQHPSQPPSGHDRAAAALVLGGARLADGRTVDVRLSGGCVEAVGTVGSLAPGARLDLTGYLLLPAPAEPHAHCDTALTADAPGPASYAPEDVQRRATEAVLLHLGHGATAVRSHVRIGGMQGLHALDAVLKASRALRGLADLSAVAVPKVLTGTAGADGLAMLRDAVKMGATVVGGCPDLDPDPIGHVEAVLEVAAEQGCAVDLHTDADDPARLARLAAMAGGLRPGVAIGPCTGLARLPQDAAARAADQLAAAGVTVVCLPQGGCDGLAERGLWTADAGLTRTPRTAHPAVDVRPVEPLGELRAGELLPGELRPSDVRPAGPRPRELRPGELRPAGPPPGGPRSRDPRQGEDAARWAAGAGRGASPSSPRCAPVRLLRAAGVPVAAGSGALRDTANPVGRGDPLEAAFLLASWGELRPPDAYRAVSEQARAMMGLPEARVEVGCPAELVAVRGDGLASALSLAYSRIVIHRGRVVARTSAVREFCDSAVAVALGLPRQAGRGRDADGPPRRQD